ncbi:MAG: MFS transporter [Thaumarchaeota archaeon]|nr:MFS transporter [Nitrososphaerota archaeon]
MLSSFRDQRAGASLIFARIVYAINWVNFGAIFYLMAPDLGTGISGDGIVTSAFYLGLGLMQIPGGVLSARWGPKRVVVTGIFLSSFAVLGTSVATDIPEAAVLRFLVGWGMAFVFAPAVIIITQLMHGGKSGMGVGLMNSAFDVGGIFGLFGWVVLAAATGWRPSLALAGALGILTGTLVALYIPADKDYAAPKVDGKAMRAVVFDRQLVLLGLGTVGFGFAYTVVSGFMTFYGVDALHVSGTLAALATVFVTVVPIFTALYGGRTFDSLSKHRGVMVACLVGSAASLVVVAFPSIAAAAAGSVLAGIVTGVGYTFAFAGARELNRAGKEYETLAVGWVNSISLSGSFAPPIIFSYIVETQGYQAAWFWTGVLTLAFVVPILVMVESWRR